MLGDGVSRIMREPWLTSLLPLQLPLLNCIPDMQKHTHASKACQGDLHILTNTSLGHTGSCTASALFRTHILIPIYLTSHMSGPGRDYWISLFINDPIHSQTVTFICTPSPASPSSVLLLFLALSSFQPSSFYSSPCNTLLIHWTNKSMAGLFSRIVITTKMFSWLDKIDSIIINIFLLGKR